MHAMELRISGNVSPYTLPLRHLFSACVIPVLLPQQYRAHLLCCDQATCSEKEERCQNVGKKAT